MTEYNEIDVKKDNLKKADEEEQVVEEREEKKQIVTKVKKRKKGLMERLVVGVLGPDGLPSIGAYVGEEIIKPAIKNIVVDTITSGINMAMFGEQRHRDTHTRTGGYSSTPTQRPTTNYSTRYGRSTAEPKLSHKHDSTRRPGTQGRTAFVEEYILGDRNEAFEVLDSMHEQIVTYGTVSVADYYDYIGVTSSYTDNKYGWDNLADAMVKPARNGYVIQLPRTMVIE